jgi:hypothetical protein
VTHLLHASELEPVETRVLVVNVGTELASTLAVASARAALPAARILLINASPAVSSIVHFQYLADAWDFDLLDVPLQWHGAILDWIVEILAGDETFVLLDSDAEIVDADWASGLIESLHEPSVYGSGFLQPGGWLEPQDVPGIVPKTCWWPTKFFTCCVALKGAAVRDARLAGASFQPTTILNDVAGHPRLSRLLAARFDYNDVLATVNPVPDRPRPVVDRFPRPARDALTRSRLGWLACARDQYEGQRPNFVYCDTGERIHAWCSTHGWQFVGPDVPRLTADDHRPAAARLRTLAGPDDGELIRWWEPGLTTKLLRSGADHEGLALAGASLTARLHDHYDIEWTEFGIPAWSWPVDFGAPLDQR